MNEVNEVLSKEIQRIALARGVTQDALADFEIDGLAAAGAEGWIMPAGYSKARFRRVEDDLAAPRRTMSEAARG